MKAAHKHCCAAAPRNSSLPARRTYTAYLGAAPGLTAPQTRARVSERSGGKWGAVVFDLCHLCLRGDKPLACGHVERSVQSQGAHAWSAPFFSFSLLLLPSSAVAMSGSTETGSALAMPPAAPAQMSPFDINEILIHIFSYLSQSTLKFSAARVCRNWFLCAKTLFWHHLHLDPANSRTWKNLDRKLPMADQLTVGRTIGPRWQVLEGADLEAWTLSVDRFMDSLSKAKEIHQTRNTTNSGIIGRWIKGKASMANDRLLEATVLDMSFEYWSYASSQVLELLLDISSDILTELSIDASFRMDFPPLSSILDQCPNLLKLSVSAFKTRHWTYPTHAWTDIWVYPAPDNDRDESSVVSHPLQLFRLGCLTATPNALKSYFPRLRNLSKIYLETLRSDQRPASFVTNRDSYHAEDTMQAFWISLSGNCPKLTAIHISHSLVSKALPLFEYDVPVALFPRVVSWGVSGRHFVTETSTWKDLNVCRVENRLTTLEFHGDENLYGLSGCQARDRLLQQFLCESPSLLHLKTGQLRVSLNVFMDAEDKTSRGWACSRLRTLAMRFAIGPYNQADQTETIFVFGYISRACPRLQRLLLGFEYQVWELRSGLCLLTRLNHLQHLEIHTAGSGQGSQSPLRATDFVWIQGTRGRSEPEASLAFPLSAISILFHSSKASVAPSWENIHDDYMACLETLRASTNYGHKPADLARLQQQQEENQYLSDYDCPVPIVDGLEGSEWCGSLLDIEARLQAQIFQLLKNNKTLMVDDRKPTAVDVASTGFFQPWPCLVEMVFSHEYASDQSIEGTRTYIGAGCGILKKWRPDVKVVGRFEPILRTV